MMDVVSEAGTGDWAQRSELPAIFAVSALLHLGQDWVPRVLYGAS